MNAVFARFCVLQAAYWGFYAAVPGYLSAYMLSQGLSAAQLGVILALNLLCAFLGSLFWGRWVDRHQASKRFFLLANASAGVLGVLLYRFSGNAVLAAVFYALFGFMAGPIPTILDAWIIAAFPQRKDASGRSRSCATLSYAFVMLLIGQWIARNGYGVMPWATALFLGVSLVTACFQPQCALPKAQTAERGVKGLLKSKSYLLLVGSMFFTGMCIAPINSMKVVVLERVGGDVALLGWDAFIGCVIQAQFLIFSGRLRAIPKELRLLLGTVMPVLYALMVGFAPNPALIIVGNIMNNISFGVLYPTMREMTEDAVRPELRNTAHSIVDVAYGSLSGMLATSWSGLALERAGASALGLVCAGLQLVAILLALGILRSGRSSRLSLRTEA